MVGGNGEVEVSDELLVAHRNGVHVLTLNRPDRLNAFTASLHASLLDALDAAERDEHCRAILLHGAGRGFSAGQDLAAVGPDPDLGDVLDRTFNPLIRKLHAIPKPVVAAVHGVAAGAGASVALACDIVLAAQSARFLQAFVNIGLIPDAGGTWVLPRLAGPVRARGMAMLGEPIEAEQAERWGLVWRVVPDEQLLEEAERTAAHLATRPTQAIGLIKLALDASERSGLDQQLDLERDLQRAAGRTPDFAEGVRAFLEKRPARFTGRPA
jgi:2-(1,2-epoxy-1,2-dihydrophenyl)acetyl-CoA isomerase